MNPEARGVTPAVQRVVQAALEARLKLEVTGTRARGAAVEVARAAAEAGTDLVIAFGGEGLLNEVANGIAGSETILAIIPGGTMNVLARNLGLPADPLEATDRILRRVGEVDPTEVALGAANGRYFLNSCGCGFDAEAALRVEAHRASKGRFGETYYYAAALTTFALSYFGRPPFLKCKGVFGEEVGVMVTGLNAGTYSYFLGRPVRLGTASLEEPRLDLFVMKRLDLLHLPSYALGALVSGRFGDQTVSVCGVEEFEVTSDEPFPIHVDGESLSPSERVRIKGGASTLRILV